MLNIILFFLSLSVYADFDEDVLSRISNTEEPTQSRYEQENIANKLLYAILPHKPFYILPISYNFNPDTQGVSGLKETEHEEAKFQFSFKLHVMEKFWQDKFQLSFAYTNLAFWQLYNKSESSPFRETNHEPELFLSYKANGFDNSEIDHIYRFGLVHQSNGQDTATSRSWNRIYAQGLFNFKSTMLSLRLWYRIPTKRKVVPTDSEGDDNPDINHYMGYFEAMVVQKFGDHTLTLVGRNNLKTENRGALQFTWSFPLNGKFKGYFQYFNGYGESLIDYNHYVQRIGIGLVSSDWL